MIIKQDELPQPVRGKVGGLSVSIRENGQIGFSTKGGEFFMGFTHCIIDFDPTTRVMSFRGADPNKPPKGYTIGNLFSVGSSKDGSARYINRAAVLSQKPVAYDYKSAGTHTFPAEISGEGPKAMLSFTLPESMVAKPKVPRKAKAKTGEAAVTGAGQASGAAAGATGNAAKGTPAAVNTPSAASVADLEEED